MHRPRAEVALHSNLTAVLLESATGGRNIVHKFNDRREKANRSDIKYL